MNRWLIDQTWCTYSTKQSPALKRRVFPTNSDAADGSPSAKRESRPYTVRKNWIVNLRVKCKVTMTVEDGRGEDLGNTNMNIYQYMICSYWYDHTEFRTRQSELVVLEVKGPWPCGLPSSPSIRGLLLLSTDPETEWQAMFLHCGTLHLVFDSLTWKFSCYINQTLLWIKPY